MTPRYLHLSWLRIFPLISNGASGRMGDLIQEKSNARWHHLQKFNARKLAINCPLENGINILL